MLRPKRIHDVTHFFLADIGLEGHKYAGAPHIAVVLWNFILENQVVTERVPGQCGEQAVILVCIVAIVGEDEVGGDRL